jgi:hypothetical protein
MPISTTSGGPERDNRMVWEGRAGHYEVWYLTVAHRASGTGFWIRYTLEAPREGGGEPYAQLWFSRFSASDAQDTFGVAKRYPASSLIAVATPFCVDIGGSRARQDGMQGAIASAVTTQGTTPAVEWDLHWEPARATYRHLPEIFYQVPVDTRVLSPNPDIAVHGSITVDGRRYDFDGEPGGQTHVWGKKHAYAWAWSHCNAFDNAPDASFESISARLKRGQIILPTLSSFGLRLDGESLDFHQAWNLPLARADFSTGSYHLVGTTADTRVEAQFSCRGDDTLMAEYLDPDGDPAFNHISCCADAVITVKKRSPFVGRFRLHRTLLARGTAHFEWGARAGDVVKVRKQLVQIP